MTTIEFGQIIIIGTLLMIAIMLLIILVMKFHHGGTQIINDPSEKIKYSKEVLDYVRDLCKQVSLIKFRDFIDTHDISKTTRNNYASIVNVASRDVHDSLIKSNIDYAALLYSDEFLQEYIVDMCSLMIRDSLNKIIDHEIDNMGK